KLADKLQCPEFLALSPCRTKIVGRNAYKARPLEGLHTARQRDAFGALDVHLQEIDAIDAQLGSQIVETNALHGMAGGGRFPSHVVRFPNRQRFDLQIAARLNARSLHSRHVIEAIAPAEGVQSPKRDWVGLDSDHPASGANGDGKRENI